MEGLRPFHLAVPVKDLKESRDFYRDVLGFEEGRSSNRWVDFNFFGHQLVIHEVEEITRSESNPVDGHTVPVPHFGVILDWEDWEVFTAKLVKAKVEFIIKPYVRFEGQKGEQATLFFLDPSGNALEFKAFRDDAEIFTR